MFPTPHSLEDSVGALEIYRPTNTRLTKLEEAILVQEVLELDAQGYGSSLDTVRDIASSICHARGGPKVGEI